MCPPPALPWTWNQPDLTATVTWRKNPSFWGENPRGAGEDRTCPHGFTACEMPGMLMGSRSQSWSWAQQGRCSSWGCSGSKVHPCSPAGEILSGISWQCFLTDETFLSSSAKTHTIQEFLLVLLQCLILTYYSSPKIAVKPQRVGNAAEKNLQEVFPAGWSVPQPCSSHIFHRELQVNFQH